MAVTTRSKHPEISTSFETEDRYVEISSIDNVVIWKMIRNVILYLVHKSSIDSFGTVRKKLLRHFTRCMLVARSVRKVVLTDQYLNVEISKVIRKLKNQGVIKLISHGKASNYVRGHNFVPPDHVSDLLKSTYDNTLIVDSVVLPNPVTLHVADAGRVHANPDTDEEVSGIGVVDEEDAMNLTDISLEEHDTRNLTGMSMNENEIVVELCIGLKRKRAEFRSFALDSVNKKLKTGEKLDDYHFSLLEAVNKVNTWSEIKILK